MHSGAQNKERAIASGLNNNCLMHCFVHSLFSLSDQKFAQVAGRPAFKELLREFQTYYQLPDPVTTDDVKKLNATYSTPHDRELIWGPVFREFLIRMAQASAKEQEVASLRAGKEIFDDTGAQLANALGANLEAHYEWEGAPGCNEYLLADKTAIFDMVVYNTIEGSGHYDFDYPDDPTGDKAKAHNASYEIASKTLAVEGQSVTSEYKKPKKSVLYDALEDESDSLNSKALIGTFIYSVIRKENVKHEHAPSTSPDQNPAQKMGTRLRANVRRRQSEPLPSAGADQAEPVPIGAGLRFSTPQSKFKPTRQEILPQEALFELKAKQSARQQTAVSNAAEGTPIPIRSTPVTEQDKPAPKKPQATDQLPKKPELIRDPISRFPKAFVDKLPVLFPDTDWNRAVKVDNISLTHKTDAARKIDIVQSPTQDEVVFNAGSVKDILTCAKAYEESVGNTFEIEYELKASSPEQAKEFMADMVAKHMNVAALTQVKINGKEISPDELASWKAELAAPTRKAMPKPNPYG